MNRTKIKQIGIIAIILLICFAAFEKSHIYSREVQGSYFSLNKGAYRLSFDCSTDNSIGIRIVDYRQNNGNNELGKVIFEGKIDDCLDNTLNNDNANNHSFVFEVTKDSDYLAFEITDGNITQTFQDNVLITLKSSDYTDAYVGFALVLIVLTISIYKELYKKEYILILFGLLMILSLNLFSPSLKIGDDIVFHKNRLKGLSAEISRFHIPSIINTEYNGSYGGETSIFYPELFLYPSAILINLGTSLQFAYKFLIILINAITVFLGFFSFSRVFKSSKLGLIATALYSFAPYRFVDLYERAAIGESLAMAFLPYLLWSILKLYYGNCNYSWIHSVLGMTAVLQSHILSAEISALFIIVSGFIYILSSISRRTPIRFKEIVFAFLTFVMVNLWFIVPFVWGIKAGDVAIGKQYYPGYYVAPPSLLVSTIGSISGSVNRDSSDFMMISIGAAVAFACAIYLFYRIKENKKDFLTDVCLIIGLISLWMCTYLFPWNCLGGGIIGKYLSMIQFAWRMCEFATLFLIVPAVRGINIAICLNDSFTLKAIIVILFVLSSVNCLDSITNDLSVITNSREECIPLLTNTDYYSYRMSHTVIEELGDTIDTNGYDVSISNYVHDGTDLSFTFSNESGAESTISAPLYDYGCYSVLLNGQKIDQDGDDKCRVEILIPEGTREGRVEVNYFVRKRNILSTLMSCIGVIGLLVYFSIYYEKRSGNTKL